MEKDPSLGTGWSYFVEDELYKEYLKGVGDQEEVRKLTFYLIERHAD